LNITSPTRIFWDCFRNSYNANPKGINGKTRILSIIGESFLYRELTEELKVRRDFLILENIYNNEIIYLNFI